MLYKIDVTYFVILIEVHILSLIIKPSRSLISQIYSWNKNLHVSESLSVYHQEFFTVHTAMVYVIEVC